MIFLLNLYINYLVLAFNLINNLLFIEDNIILEFLKVINEIGTAIFIVIKGFKILRFKNLNELKKNIKIMIWIFIEFIISNNIFILIIYIIKLIILMLKLYSFLMVNVIKYKKWFSNYSNT